MVPECQLNNQLMDTISMVKFGVDIPQPKIKLYANHPMNYRSEIDGLRAIAVLPVILFHAGFLTFSGGFVGVDVFFVISGYLITSIILADLEKGTFSLAGFYERRARRILPTLYVVMFACLPFAEFLLLPHDLKRFSQSLVAVTTFSSNILFYLTSGYFETANELKPLLHTWSLAAEEQYYVLFPLFLMLTQCLQRPRLIALLVLLAAFSLAGAHWGSYMYPTFTFYMLPTRGWELLLGSFVAFFYQPLAQPINDKSPRPIAPLAHEATSVLGLLLIAYAVFAFDKHTPYPSLYTLAPTLGTALIILFASNQTQVGRQLGSPLWVGIGLVSYSAYLWHQPLFAFARIASPGAFSPITKLTFIALTFLAAFLSWRYVERPFRDKETVASRKLWLLAAGFALLFITLGSIGTATDGFYQWSSQKTQQRSQLLKELMDERGKLIRLGVCHYNADINKTGVTEFLKNWDCATDKSQLTLQKIPIIFTGDSHSTDKVMALKLNGLVPLQMTGAGCPLVPSRMSHDCQQIFEKLYQLVAHDNAYQYIALSHYFEPADLTLAAIQEMLNYWQKFNKKIIFFTAMPDFLGFGDKFLTTDPMSPDFTLAHLSEQQAITQTLVSRGVHVINTHEIFCAIAPQCDWQLDQKSLLMHQNHLSKEGAQQFGRILIKTDPIFKSLAATGSP